MTIDIPELDNKTYEELLEEAKKRLPAYDDGWTDYNPSDPGITILELFAYLTDTYTYQLDTITDEHRRKYLQLMGEGPKPPEPASVQLGLSLTADDTQATVPAGTKLRVVDGSDTEKIFETVDDVVLTNATIESVVTTHGGGEVDHSQANRKDGMYYRAFGSSAEESSAMYLGFDGDPFGGTESLSLTVNFHEDDLPPTATHGDEQPQFYPSVSVRWEYCHDYENAHRNDAWHPLSVTRDGTYAFYRSGRITLTQPDDWAPSEWEQDDHSVVGQEPGYLWLRCRVQSGGYEIPPQFDSIRLNVVDATHRSTVENEQLVRSDSRGDPSMLIAQTYDFQHAPVLEADITVDGVRWEEVEDFDASSPTDRHYVLDRRAGRVRFGDGITGRMPEPDATVVATEYVFGGGRDGNVPASANWQFLHRENEIDEGVTLGDVSITAEGAGTGGSDGESLSDAFRRTKHDLKTPYRAVTAEDYEYVATHTPGLRFGRATVLVEERSDLGIDADPVEVRVVVVPYAPLSQSHPEPSEGFLDAVQTHLDTYRLLTDRVKAQAPHYVSLSFDIEVQTSTWMPQSRVDRAVESAIAEYIHPVHGFEGDGWPFGRPLYTDDIIALLEEIEFVDNVRDVSLHARGNARVDGDGNVLIDDSTLFALDSVETQIRTVATDRNGA